MTKAKEEVAAVNNNPVGVFVPVGQVLARAGTKPGSIDVVEINSEYEPVLDKDGEIKIKDRKVERVTIIKTVSRKEFLAKHKAADQQATQI